MDQRLRTWSIHRRPGSRPLRAIQQHERVNPDLSIRHPGSLAPDPPRHSSILRHGSYIRLRLGQRDEFGSGVYWRTGKSERVWAAIWDEL